MRIGLSSIYAWRPHVEHLAYLNHLLVQDGHETFFLVCDSQLSSCYVRELRRTARIRECPVCMIGGLRSFVAGPFATLNRDAQVTPRETLQDIALSSAHTLVRTEAKEDKERSDFKEVYDRLTSSVERAYSSARHWIEDQRLDALLVFNGRMDATRALLDAAKDAGIPVITVERTWFSDGLLLTPNDGPLELKQHHRLNIQFRDEPLTRNQSILIAHRIASRFLQTNDTEWRSYNKDAVSAPWPASRNGLKTLILPSSRNEVVGHPDWQTGWSNFGDALDAVMDHLKIDSSSTVLRCHPNWSEHIGTRTGELSEFYYSGWAKGRGVTLVNSGDKVSSQSLMAEADLIIVNGGSAVFEASALGKPCITLSPSTYSEAGFCAKVFSADMLHNCESVLSLPSRQIIKLGLRYGYTHNFRHSQFTRYVRAKSPVEFTYYCGADIDRLIKIFESGHLQPDDAEISSDDVGETQICELIAAKAWKSIAALTPEEIKSIPLQIKRRFMLRWLDKGRRILPRGDV